MTPDIAATAVERTEAARRLIDEAQAASFVELVTVSALELCVLGGPRHALFEEPVTQAWAALGDRRRGKIMKLTTDGMVERRLLLPEPSPERGTADYALDPALGIVLAARSRPAFVVVTETAASSLRTPRFLALGDQEVPVRAIVVEEPAALPAGSRDFPNLRKLGPLGRFYRYLLVSQARAAELLAEWAIAPPPSGADSASARSVSRFRPGGADPGAASGGGASGGGASGGAASGGGASGGGAPRGAGALGMAAVRIDVRGDGTTARLARPPEDGPGQDYDRAGLAGIMLELMARAPG
jgi:hypothetical protein